MSEFPDRGFTNRFDAQTYTEDDISRPGQYDASSAISHFHIGAMSRDNLLNQVSEATASHDVLLDTIQ